MGILIICTLWCDRERISHLQLSGALSTPLILPLLLNSPNLKVFFLFTVFQIPLLLGTYPWHTFKDTTQAIAIPGFVGMICILVPWEIYRWIFPERELSMILIAFANAITLSVAFYIWRHHSFQHNT